MSTEQIRASQIDFVNDSKEKKKKKGWGFQPTTQLLEKRVPLLSIHRITDRHLRNTAVAFWPPTSSRDIFWNLPLWQVHENDTALFKGHMALDSSAETPPSH